MADQPAVARTRTLFGRLAVEKGYITDAQLEQVLRLHAQLGGAHPLGSLFMQRGLLSLGQVQELIALQRQGEAREASPPPAPPPGTAVRAPIPARPFDPFQVDARPPAPGQRPTGVGAPPPWGVPAPAQGARPPAPPEPPPPPPKIPAEYAPLLPQNSRDANRVSAMIDAAEKRRASDIHFHPNVPPVLRIDGKLYVNYDQPLDVKALERDLLHLLSEEQRTSFNETGDLDFAYVTPSGLRTRANLYRSHGGTDATFRLLPRGPQSLEELNLPGTLAKLVSYHQGLVLVTGPAGSGKSATLAALVNLLNEERPDHILLLEDPIEIIHPAKKALVNQRQVRRDTESFARALRGALREDPDVIVIGDLRDRETISLAITAAETGHLVIGSMNTNNASRTVGRLIDAFPPVQQGQVRAMLSESLRGVVSQKLVLGKAGRRLPAIELLFNTAAIGNVIRKGELVQLRSQMQVGKSLGMRTFDESLKDLVAADKLDGDEARKHAESPSSIPNSGAPSPLVAGTPQPAVPPPGAAAPRGPMGMPPKPAAPAASAVRPNPLVPRPGSRS